MKRDTNPVRREVRKGYGKAAARESSCCASGYSAAELARVPAGAVLGLGSGNPVRHARLRKGEVVADLGSGAGIDAFLAADRVGPRGRAIGVDMTPEMLQKARRLAAENKVGNVEFREGLIEELPLEDGTVDVVLSNCVINLSPDKPAVFREAFRILKPGGRLVISDIVKERPFKTSDPVCGCVSNAMVRGPYLDAIRAAGFRDLEVVEDRPYVVRPDGVDASAITIRAKKPPTEVTT